MTVVFFTRSVKRISKKLSFSYPVRPRQRILKNADFGSGKGERHKGERDDAKQRQRLAGAPASRFLLPKGL